jgi:hypothetical protein
MEELSHGNGQKSTAPCSNILAFGEELRAEQLFLAFLVHVPPALQKSSR